MMENQARQIVDKSFLEWIDKEDNQERILAYEENENYYKGDIDVIIPSNMRLRLEKELQFTGNVCKAVVDAAVRFLSREPLSVEIALPREEEPASPAEGESPTEEQKQAWNDRDEAEAWIYSILRDSNFLYENFAKALRIQGKKGELALKAYPIVAKETPDEEKGTVVGYRIAALRPDICYPKWKDEEHGEMEYFAIKYRRLNPQTKKPELFAQVFWPDKVIEFVKPISTSGTVSGEWELLGEYDGYGFIPIEWVKNKADDGPWSEADITTDLKDLQNAINKSITDLVHAGDHEAFRQGFVMGAEPPKDSKGEQKPIQSGPGKLHWVGGTDTKIPKLDFFPPSDFTGLLESVDKYMDLVSTVSQVPKNELSRSAQGGTPTGVALRTIYQPFIGKCDEKRGLLKDALERIIAKIFRMAISDQLDLGFQLREYQAEIHIGHGLPTDEKENMEVLEIQARNKWKSNETIMQELGIEDIEKEKEKIRQEMEEMALYREQARIDEELAALEEEDIDPDEEL